jgi:hypothetical protein
MYSRKSSNFVTQGIAGADGVAEGAAIAEAWGMALHVFNIQASKHALLSMSTNLSGIVEMIANISMAAIRRVGFR